MPHFLWPEPLSPAQLKRLEEHKYSAAGRSLFEPPCQIYWNWLVQQIPTWVAPNTLTIVGLLVNILSTVVLVYYCPTATEEVSTATLVKVSTRRLIFACDTSIKKQLACTFSRLLQHITFITSYDIIYFMNQQRLLVNSA